MYTHTHTGLRASFGRGEVGLRSEKKKIVDLDEKRRDEE
jgi:hypothetical protein